MDEPYFNVIYSWKLSAKTLTNLIDLFNNIIFQARQTSQYKHWLDQASAAECHQCREADRNGKWHFHPHWSTLVKNAHPQMVSLSCIFGFLSGGKLFFGSSLRWCLLLSWLVQGLSCRQCWCCCCAHEMLTSTKCSMSANDHSAPCSPHPASTPPALFPVGLQIYATALDLFQTAFWHWGLSGTTGGTQASKPADGCVARANGRLHQKGQNPSVSRHLSVAGPRLWAEGHRSHRRLPASGMKKERASSKVQESWILKEVQHNIYVWEKKTILKLYQTPPLCTVNF